MFHIIVPIDFSEESLHGLNLAILFSKSLDCDIEMVYVQKKSLDYYPGTKEGRHQYHHADERRARGGRRFCERTAAGQLDDGRDGAGALRAVARTAGAGGTLAWGGR